MKNTYLEAGKIVNTHGVCGEVKVLSWCDSPEFLATFKTVYIDEKPVSVLGARVHKGSVLMELEGVSDVNAAMRLKEKVVFVNRGDIDLSEGQVFVQDLIGLPVYDERVERVVGCLEAVDNMPAHDVYVVKEGEKLHMIPAVAPFLIRIEPDERIVVRTIGGMLDED